MDPGGSARRTEDVELAVEGFDPPSQPSQPAPLGVGASATVVGHLELESHGPFGELETATTESMEGTH